MAIFKVRWLGQSAEQDYVSVLFACAFSEKTMQKARMQALPSLEFYCDVLLGK